MNRYKIGIQLTIPDGFSTNEEWIKTVSMVSNLGIDHLELNMSDPSRVDASELMKFLRCRDLKVTKLATGHTAKLEKLSLCSPDFTIRDRTLKRCKDFNQLAKELNCDIILGYIKGLVDLTKPESDKNLVDSLQRLENDIIKQGIKVYLEATNRHETTSVNTVDEGFGLINDLSGKGFTVLPDTYHMNIEETDLPATLKKNIRAIDTIHISDNNRFYPGLGTFDFSGFFAMLESFGFIGTLTIEGNIKDSFENDLRQSISYLNGL